VAKAYRLLEQDGLVHGDGRRGTSVAPAPTRPDDERHRLIAAAAHRYLAEARRLGASAAEAQAELVALVSRS
jgi:DNA-binding transcriptional regulator YhcF (GntR family)